MQTRKKNHTSPRAFSFCRPLATVCVGLTACRKFSPVSALGWLLTWMTLVGWPLDAVLGQEDTVVPSRQIGDSQLLQDSESAEVSLSEVRGTLRKLDADELQTRDAAEKALIAMGPSVLAFLPEVTDRTSGEMKVRLQRIRQSLQQRDVEAYFEASTVTLSGKMNLQAALDQILEQTRNPVEIQGGEVPNVEVTLSAEKQSFWAAMSEIMSQTQLRINAYGATEGQLVLAPGAADYGNAPSNYTTGPFRLDVISVRSTLPFNSPMGGQLDCSFLVTWEPRLEPVFMQLPMETLQATLTDGTVLPATNPRAAPEIALNLGTCSTQIDLQLARPSREASEIETLKGEFVIAVPSDRHKYVFEKFGSGARQSEKFGDVTVTLEGARRNGAVYEMPIYVQFGDSQGALDSFRGWILSNEAYLMDANDRRLENLGMNTYAVTPNAVGIAYRFQVNGDPDSYRLVYESPAAVTKQRVEYELKNIPLP